VRKRLDDISERVFAIHEPIGPARQEAPNLGTLPAAARYDPLCQCLKIRIGNAKMEDAGLPITEVVGGRRNRRFKELEKLDPDAVCGQKVRLMRPDELWPKISRTSGIRGWYSMSRRKISRKPITDPYQSMAWSISGTVMPM
jgi:hypothetical protein